eukprot:637888-Pyramimonas_sp.AAC.1
MVAPPSPALLRRVANKMHYSEPGLDSIPYSAWAATDAGINVWLPKGEEIEDSLATGCTRSPGAVRVLGLRNTDIKVIAATVNIQFSKLLMYWAPRSQRGFIPKGNFGVNILDLDVAAR